MTKQTKQVEQAEELSEMMWEIERDINDIEAYDYSDSTRKIMEKVDRVMQVALAQAQQEAVERVKALRKTDRFAQSLNTFDGKTKTFNRLSDADINYNRALDDVLEALQQEQELPAMKG